MAKQPKSEADEELRRQSLAAFTRYVEQIRDELASGKYRPTPSEIARQSDMDPSTVNRLLDFKGRPSWVTLHKLAQGTKVPVLPELVPGYPVLPTNLIRRSITFIRDSAYRTATTSDDDVYKKRLQIVELALSLPDSQVSTVLNMLRGLNSPDDNKGTSRHPPPKAEP